MNRHLADMLGYSPAEMLGRPAADLMFPADLPDHQARMAQRRQGLGDNYERRFRRRDGSELWTVVAVSALLDAAGNFQGSFAMFTDITERKLLEESLRQSEEKFRTVADFTYDWETWVGPDNKPIYVSPSCRRLTGYTVEEFMANPRLLEEITHPDDRGLIKDHFQHISAA